MRNLPPIEDRTRYVEKLNRQNDDRARRGYTGPVTVEWLLGMPMDSYEKSHERLGCKEYRILKKK